MAQLNGNLKRQREDEYPTLRQFMHQASLCDNGSTRDADHQPPFNMPPFDHSARLKSELSSLRDRLDNLLSFHEGERQKIELYCDQLECDVMTACESAMRYFQEMEQEMVKEISVFRQKCLDAWSARNPTQSPSLNETSKEVELKLDALAKEIKMFGSKWDRYLNQQEVSAPSIYVALNKADDYKRTIRSVKREMEAQVFNGKLLVFKPVDAFYDDKNFLKNVCKFQLNYESTDEITITDSPKHSLAEHTDEVNQVLFTPDGRLVSCSQDKTIKVWSRRDCAKLFELTGHTGWVYCLAMLPNGCLASGSADETIKLWDLETKKEIGTLYGHNHFVISLRVLKNGNLVSYSHDDMIKIWNPYLPLNQLITSIQCKGIQSTIIPLTITSNDMLITCFRENRSMDETTLKVWNPQNGELVKSVNICLLSVRSILGIAGDQVAIGTAYGAIKVIDYASKKPLRIENAYERSVTAFAQLSNGNLLSAGTNRDGTQWIKQWDLRTLTLVNSIKTDHTEAIVSLCVSRDETTLASASKDRLVKIWPISLNFV